DVLRRPAWDAARPERADPAVGRPLGRELLAGPGDRARPQSALPRPTAPAILRRSPGDDRLPRAEHEPTALLGCEGAQGGQLRNRPARARAPVDTGRRLRGSDRPVPAARAAGFGWAAAPAACRSEPRPCPPAARLAATRRSLCLQRHALPPPGR